VRRWETLTALAGVISAVAGASRFPGHAFFTYLAIALIGVVSISRLQFALASRRATPSDAAERARRIREGRGR
jgi:hypothetical protein